MRLMSIAAAALLAIAPGTASAQAQGRPIELAAGQPYVHKPTGLTVPATLGDLPRTGAAALEADQLDEYVNFQSGNEVLSVYVFRNVAGSVSLWFDRAVWMIERRPDVFGTVTPLDRPPAFAPPKQSNSSGMTRTWLTGKGPFRSTGAAVMPLGADWYVKIRYSSATHSAEALAPRLAAVVAALGWPQGVAESPAAVPIADCATPLTYAPDARLNKPDMTESLMGALIASAASTKAQENPAQIRVTEWCRESGGSPRFGVYRDAASTDGYMMAIGDAGRVVTVRRGIPLQEKPASYQLSLQTLSKTLVYPTFDKLPRPEAALEAMMKARPVSSTARDGKNINITVPK